MNPDFPVQSRTSCHWTTPQGTKSLEARRSMPTSFRPLNRRTCVRGAEGPSRRDPREDRGFERAGLDTRRDCSRSRDQQADRLVPRPCPRDSEPKPAAVRLGGGTAILRRRPQHHRMSVALRVRAQDVHRRSEAPARESRPPMPELPCADPQLLGAQPQARTAHRGTSGLTATGRFTARRNQPRTRSGAAPVPST